MSKLKSPAAWLGFLCAVGALAMLPGGPIPAAALPWIGFVTGVLGLAGSWFFDAPPPSGPSGGAAKAAVVLVGLGLGIGAGCATINHFVCGQTGHLVPPDAQLCTVAALQAASEIAVNVPACAASPTSAACIDAVISAGKDLSPCLPTCVSDAKQGRSVSIAPNVLRANVCQSLAATGHGNACK